MPEALDAELGDELAEDDAALDDAEAEDETAAEAEDDEELLAGALLELALALDDAPDEHPAATTNATAHAVIARNNLSAREDIMVIPFLSP